MEIFASLSDLQAELLCGGKKGKKKKSKSSSHPETETHVETEHSLSSELTHKNKKKK
jgi:hypothetical protein